MDTGTSNELQDYAPPKRDPVWFGVLVIVGLILGVLILVGIVADGIYNHWRYGS